MTKIRTKERREAKAQEIFLERSSADFVCCLMSHLSTRLFFQATSPELLLSSLFREKRFAERPGEQKHGVCVCGKR